jgi:hypothetical protein
MRLPAHMLTSTMVVEAYLGQAGAKPSYGASVEVACYVEWKRRRVLSSDGERITATGGAWVQLDAPDTPVKSRVTIDGRAATVVAETRHDSGPFTLPYHRELALS